MTDDQETGDAFKNDIVRMIEIVRTNVDRYLHLRISAGISRFYSSYNQLSEAYQESLSALKYRILREREAVLFIEDVEPERQMVFFPDHLEKQLVEAVHFADEKMAKELLGEWGFSTTGI